MATSKYFNYSNHKGTQRLINDLVVEMIQQRGIDVEYIPRNIENKNPILNEADHVFNEALTIEGYLEEYAGVNSMMWEKFGGFIMETQVTMVFSRTRWDETFATAPGGRNQLPQEGDLIYFPLSNQFFKVNTQNDDEDFMQFGKYYTYRLLCTLYDYNNEEFSTGNDDIDDIENRLEQLDIESGDTAHKESMYETDNAFGPDLNKELAPNKTLLDFGDD